jgi:hypothetical protein
MRRLLLYFAAVLVAVIVVPAALADGGPLTVVSGGGGVVDGTTRYVPVDDPLSGDTELLAISTRDGTELNQLGLVGEWGLPYTSAGAEGLSHDGKTLVLADSQAGFVSPSTFLVVNPRRMKLVRTIMLRGYFSFDALSPNGSRIYLIQYTHGASQDLTHYIVRGYDLRRNRLMPGRIVDRSEHEESMAGSPVTRTTSADGRWVYTLYQKPSGEQFIHALDTVGVAAYCVDLPENLGLFGVLSLRKDDQTLAVSERSGRRRLDVAVGSWRISYPRGSFPWAWVGGGIGGGVALLGVCASLLRRRRSEELEEDAGEELGFAERHVVV